MNTLVENFHLLAAAPNGVAKLRELILNLAVRGKLVPQDPKDEPAGELLKKIATEKARLLKEGKIKKDKPLLEIFENDKPYILPQGWAWLRLGDMALSIKSGGTPSKQNHAYWDGDIPWASVKDLRFGDPLVSTQDKITKAGLDAGSVLAEAGSILICTRMGLGKIGEAIIDVAINQDLKSVLLSSWIDKQYFINFYKTLSIAGSGMTVAGIKQDELLGFVVPIPPLAEQQRIVAKVDELMRLCDHLEAQQTMQGEAHERLVAALLDSLTQSADAQAFADNWARLVEHFELLLDTPESIAKLKQTLLQLAVQGKLVPQDPNDEPASELLKKIAAEKARLIKEGKIKKDKLLPEIVEDEKPYQLPQGWKWVRLGDVSQNVQYGYTASANHTNRDVLMMRITDIQDDMVDWQTVPGCDITESDLCSYALSNGDIVIARTGGTIGKSFLVSGLSHNAVFASYLIRIQKLENSYPPFTKVFLGSQLYWRQLTASSMGTGQPNVNGTALKSLLLPLPPLAEQHRIVAKVDELMRVCDALSNRLTRSRELAQQFCESVVQQAI